MHPILASPRRLALYLVAWVPVALLLALATRGAEPRPPAEAAAFFAALVIVYAFVCLSVWWLCRALPLGQVPALRLVATHLATAVAASLLWVAFAGAWSDWLARGPTAAEGRRSVEMMSLAFAGTILYLLSGTTHYLVAAFESARAAERRALEAQVAAREAELRALRAQVDPHFLFNSLNTISGLVRLRPDDARLACERLGDLLRASLRLGACDLIPLREELALVDSYLGIEELRFSERLQVARRVDPKSLDCLVPPLLLQPLIENAVNHGIASLVEGGTIEVAVQRRDERLEIAIENPREETAPAPRRGHGLGLDNVRRRLDALDSRASRIEIAPARGRFRVTVLLPALLDKSATGAPGITSSASAERATAERRGRIGAEADLRG